MPWPGGIGTWRALIGFTNISKQACTIGGYPDVVAVDRSGATVSGAENPASALVSPSYPAGALVTLAPGDQAGAETSGGEIESGPTRVDVPPGGAASFAIVSATAYGGGTHIVTLTRLTFTLPGNGGQLQMATIIPVTRPNETGPYPLSETALVAGTGGPNS